MDKRLKEYLQSHGAKLVDERELKKFDNAMVETVIPKIIEDIKINRQLVAERRFTPAKYPGKENKSIK